MGIEFAEPNAKENQPVEISLDVSKTAARSIALDLDEAADVDVLDTLFEEMACDVEPVHDLLAQLIRSHSLRKPRDGEILAARFGIDGEQPETLTRIGARHELSRERIRQLANRGMSQLSSRSRASKHDVSVILEFRYPPELDSDQLTRILTIETCATGTNRIARELSYLKLRIAGHPDEVARDIAARVVTNASTLRRHIARTRRRRQDDERRATAHLQQWLCHVDWPVTDQFKPAHPVLPPTVAARTVDLSEEGRGSVYLEKLCRNASFDSGHEARLLRILNNSNLIHTFQEQPVAISYQFEGATRHYFPDVVARLTDGRVILIEVKPVTQLAFHINQTKFAAGRTYAHEQGWGWLVWTGRTSIPDLLQRRIDPDHEHQLRQLVLDNRADWRAVHWFVTSGRLDLLDVIAITLRNSWRWERAPFRLRAHTAAKVVT